jgi:hypothetical protein
MASCGPAEGHSIASENADDAHAEVFAKGAAALEFACEENARSSCALATLTEASTSETTRRSLFIFSLFEG